MASTRIDRGVAALGLLLLLGGCAGGLMRSDGGFRHPGHGYTIESPEVGWERVGIDGTQIAYRRAGSLTMSLMSSCGRPVADPGIMARHLTIGLDDRTLRQGGPVVIDGRSGWVQTFDTRYEDRSVRVKTVTLVEGDCTYDFTLAGTGAFEEAEPGFDAWWGSFKLAPRAGAGGDGARP